MLYSGQNPYACQQCDLSFTISHHLKRHMWTDSREKQCDQRFTQSSEYTYTDTQWGEA